VRTGALHGTYRFDWDGAISSSKGTKDCARRPIEAGIPTYLIVFGEGGAEAVVRFFRTLLTWFIKDEHARVIDLFLARQFNHSMEI
jgi:hypothetical protein